MKKMRDIAQPARIQILSAILTLFVPFCFLGCSDRSQQFEDRIAELKKKIELLQGQLESAKNNVNKTEGNSPSDSTNSSSPPTKEALQSSYESLSKSLREEISSKLTGFRIESCTLQSVQMPENLYPFTSEISISLRSSDGKPYQLDLPVKANYAGKWFFPDANEIVERINAVKSVAPITEKEAAGNQAPSKSRPPMMSVDGTIVIQWGDAPKSPPPSHKTSESTATSAPSAPASTPVPTPPPAPAPDKQPVMPVNRDVHIKFNQ